MKNADQQPQTFSSKILITLMAFIFTLISFSVGYIVINLYYRWYFDDSFRYLLLGTRTLDLYDIFKTFRSFFILGGVSILLALLPVQNIKLGGLRIFRSRYLITLLYGLVWIVYGILDSFLNPKIGLASGAVAYYIILAFLGTVYSFISIFIFTRLWPFSRSRGKITFFIVIFIAIMYFILLVELIIGRNSGTQQIHTIETIQAKPEIISKGEFDSISGIGRQATIPDDKRFVGRGGNPIKWVDDEQLIFDINYGSDHELWIKNIRNQEALKLVPIGGISYLDLFAISPDKKWLAFTTDFIDAIDTTSKIISSNSTEYKYIGGGIILVKLDGTKIFRIHPPICGRMDEDDPLAQYGDYCGEIKWDANGVYVFNQPYLDKPELFIKLKFSLPSE